MPNNVVLTQKLLQNGNGITLSYAGNGTVTIKVNINHLRIWRPFTESATHLIVQTASSSNYADATTVIDTKNVSADRTKVLAATGLGFISCPANGLGSAFSGQTILVDLSSVSNPTFIRYAWSSSAGLGDWQYTHFYSAGGAYAYNDFVRKSMINVANGVAGLDADGKLLPSVLPILSTENVVPTPTNINVVQELMQQTGYWSRGAIDKWIQFKWIRINDFDGENNPTKWRPYYIGSRTDPLGSGQLPAITTQPVFIPSRQEANYTTITGAWTAGESGIGDHAVALVYLSEDDAKDLAFSFLRARLPKEYPALEGTGAPSYPPEYTDAVAYMWRLMEIEAINNGAGWDNPQPSIRKLRTLYEASEYFTGTEDYLALGEAYTNNWVLVRPYIIRESDYTTDDPYWPETDPGPFPRYGFGSPTYQSTSPDVRGYCVPVFKNPFYPPRKLPDFRLKIGLNPNTLTRISTRPITVTGEVSKQYITTVTGSQYSEWLNPVTLSSVPITGTETPVTCMAVSEYEMEWHPLYRKYHYVNCPVNWYNNLEGVITSIGAAMKPIFEHRRLSYAANELSIPVPSSGVTGLELYYNTYTEEDDDTNPSTVTVTSSTLTANLIPKKVVHVRISSTCVNEHLVTFIDAKGETVSDIVDAAFCLISLNGIPGHIVWAQHKWINGTIEGVESRIKLPSYCINAYATSMS